VARKYIDEIFTKAEDLPKADEIPQSHTTSNIARAYVNEVIEKVESPYYKMKVMPVQYEIVQLEQ
jgi:hypothetical protein